MKLSKTEEKIMDYLYSISDSKSSLTEVTNNIMVLNATIYKELKKLVTKGIIIVNGSEVYLSDFGKKTKNYNDFRMKVISEFCNSNKLDCETYNSFIKNRNYSNMKLLLGIKNLLSK